MTIRISTPAITAGIVSAAIFAAQASAQELTEAVPLRNETWSVRAEPSVLFFAPGGTVRLPTFAAGSTTPAISQDTFSVSELKADDPAASPFAEMHLSKGDWRFSLRGVSMSGDSEALAQAPGAVGDFTFATGDLLRTSLSHSQYEVDVAYLLKAAALEPYESGHKLQSKFELIGGARLFDVEWDVRNVDNGSSGTDDVTLFEPFAGAKLSLRFYERFDADLQLTFGGMPAGDSNSLSIDVIVGGTYRFTDNLGLQVGYRFMGFELESADDGGEFDWSGSIAGLYVGAMVEF